MTDRTFCGVLPRRFVSLAALAVTLMNPTAPVLAEVLVGNALPTAPFLPVVQSQPGSALPGTFEKSPIPTTPGSGLLDAAVTRAVASWGLVPAPCTDDAAKIRSGVTAICVVASRALPAGEYAYDPVANRLDYVPRALLPLPKFSFPNAGAYSNCVEDIVQLHLSPQNYPIQQKTGSCAAELIQLYGEGGLTKGQARELLKAADAYAANFRLYPQWGQRERIAMLFGFTYGLDAQNPAISKLAAGADR